MRVVVVLAVILISTILIPKSIALVRRNFYRPTCPKEFPHLKFNIHQCTSADNLMNWDPRSAPKLDFSDDFYAVLECSINSDVVGINTII